MTNPQQQTIEQSEKAWNKHAKTFKQQILSLIRDEKIKELELHRGDAIGGGKAGIVMSCEEVVDRLQQLRKEK